MYQRREIEFGTSFYIIENFVPII